MILPSDQNATGRTLGSEEIKNLQEAIESGVLTSTKGSFTKGLEQEFAKANGVPQAHACSSGTAAIHCAVAAIDPEPGDEIITTAITDMGALAPILYQSAIPVFADVDPETCNVTAETIAPRITDRTKAILVTHLFGNPCDMEAIVPLAKAKNIPIIEDCAQAFGATVNGKPVGTLGDIGCFSLQQGKHITTGEGGLVITANEHYGRRMFLFINKAWGYGDKNPDHYFLAPNYRMSELQGAVALAQFKKLNRVVEQRTAMAHRLSEKLQGIEGVKTPKILPGHVHTYWKYCLMVNKEKIEGGSPGLGASLKDQDIPTAPRYIQKPAFRCEVFRDRRTFGNSQFPFNLASPAALDYSEALFPGTFKALGDVLVLAWNEGYREEHVDYIATAIQESAAKLGKVSA